MDEAAIIQAILAANAANKGQQISAEQVDLLKQQLARIQGVALPDLQQVTPDQLGPSAVGSMSSDEGSRSKQLAAISELQNIIDQGGLNYSDKASLEEALGASQNQQHRAQAGVAADAASRGQLNSGNRLLMDMNASQQGANAARQTGLAVAGQAQARKLAAIQEAAGLTSQMRGEDWNEQSQANSAKDARDQLNAGAREKAQYYNAGLAQQGFNNAMAKATGSGNPTNALVGGLENAGNGMRADTAMISNAVGAAGSLYNPKTSGGSTYTYDPAEQADLNGQRGGYQDLSNPDDK